MANVPQIAGVTDLSQNYKPVFAKLSNGPVFLTSRSKPAAVLLSTTEYERLADAEAELKRLRRIMQADQDFADMRTGDYGILMADGSVIDANSSQ